MNILKIRNRVAQSAWNRKSAGPHRDKKWHSKNRKRNKVKNTEDA
jgi:hypothetical protein